MMWRHNFRSKSIYILHKQSGEPESIYSYPLKHLQRGGIPLFVPLHDVQLLEAPVQV